MAAPETTTSSTTTTTLPTTTTTTTTTTPAPTTTTTTETPPPTHRDRPFDDPDNKYNQVRINSILTLMFFHLYLIALEGITSQIHASM